MTHFSDGVRTGQAVWPPAGGPDNLAGLGGANSPVYVYDILPLQAYSNTIATAQTVSGASWTLTAGSGITATTIGGSAVYALDVPRNIVLTGNVSTVTPVNVTVVGFDTYKQPMSETFSSPTGTAATSGAKAFAYVYSVTAAGNTTSAVAVGQGDKLGFPYRVNSPNYVDMAYSGTRITASTGFTAADATAATALTGDVRGTYLVQSATDGVKRFTAFMFLKDVNTSGGLYGVTQA